MSTKKLLQAAAGAAGGASKPYSDDVYSIDVYDSNGSARTITNGIDLAGEGGMVSSDDEELISIARKLAWWGRDCYCVGAQNKLSDGTCGKRFDKWIEKYDGIIDHKYVYTHMRYNLKQLDFQRSV